MTFEVYALIILASITGFHFAHSVATAHRIKAQYDAQTQIVRHQGHTSVATGFKPRVAGQ
jgi:hypothetical protein